MYNQLTDKERYIIDLLLQENYSQKYIAERLFRSESTISREINRNKTEGKYDSEIAIKLTKSRRFRKYKVKFTKKAMAIIEKKLEIGYSPKQITEKLKKENIFISYELIYQYIDKNRNAGVACSINLCPDVAVNIGNVI